MKSHSRAWLNSVPARSCSVGYIRSGCHSHNNSALIGLIPMATDITSRIASLSKGSRGQLIEPMTRVTSATSTNSASAPNTLADAMLKEQKTIIAKLDAMLAETQHPARLHERKHAALEELKKSLLHQAFTGEL
jgi:hypothetical protein